ncbi:MAG: hypothetical protein ACLUVC_14655 [Longibaculum sp.]
MRKQIIMIVLIVLCFQMNQVYASSTVQYGNCENELYEWYMSDSQEFHLTGDLVITENYLGKAVDENAPWIEYIGFCQTDISKTIVTGDYSLIIDYDFLWLNPNLKIIGNGANKSVVVLNKYNEFHYVNIEAKEGSAMTFDKESSFWFCESYGKQFPSQIQAKTTAIDNHSSSRNNSIACAKICSQGEAIISDFDLDIDLSVIDTSTLAKTIRLDSSCLNGKWRNCNGEIWELSDPDIEITDPITEKVYVGSYDTFDWSLLPETIEINYCDVPIQWDKEIDFHQTTNTISGTIQIMKEFEPFIEPSVSIDICIKEITPIQDFSIDDLEERLENCYCPFFSMTNPDGYKQAFLEVSLDGQNFDSYDISEEISYSFPNDENRISFSFQPKFSAVPFDKDYYYRVRIVGGFYEGISNIVKVSKGKVEDVIEIVPDDSSNQNNGNETLPDIIDGNDGHRGDQNRDDVVDKKDEVILEPEDIETMGKTNEDVLIIIDDKKASIPKTYIKEWKQQKETITIKINDKNQVVYQVGESSSQVMENVKVENQKELNQEKLLIDNQKQIATKNDFSKGMTLGIVIAVSLIIIGGIALYRRKKYAK